MKSLKIAEDVAKHAQENNETMKDFKRVKKLLSEVESKSVYSQQGSTSSRIKMET